MGLTSTNETLIALIKIASYESVEKIWHLYQSNLNRHGQKSEATSIRIVRDQTTASRSV